MRSAFARRSRRRPRMPRRRGSLPVSSNGRASARLDAFLQAYGLPTEEGVALMYLTEALLRVPHTRAADALIRDKIGAIDWSEHLGESSSTFVNAVTFSLILTGEVLERPELHQRGMGATYTGRSAAWASRSTARRRCRRCASSVGSSCSAARSTRR